MAIRLLFMAFFLFLPSLSQAAGQGTAKHTKAETGFAELRQELADGFDHSMRALVFGTYQGVADSSQNPDNDFLQIPRHKMDLEFRPDAYLKFRWLQGSVKPRFNLEWQAWEEGGREGDRDLDADVFVNEWLVRAALGDSLFLSYGRENLQWGPSYLLSPSNPFFRDNGRSNPKQEVPGMDFGRLVWVPGMPWTVSFIANVDEGRQPFFFSDFDKTYAVKMDYAGQDRYASLIVSRKEKDRVRLGAFGGWTTTDALLLYGEGAFSRGTDALYPTEAENPFETSMEAISDDDSSLKGTLLIGGAYTLEIGPTLAIEYVFNSPGYSDKEAEDYYGLRQTAADASSQAGSIGDLGKYILSRTADPKLRLLRRNYIMFQYLHSDIQDVLDLTFRWTQNMDDGSGRFISIVEYYMGDHVQLFSIGTVNAGGGDTEFGSILDMQWMIGMEYFF